MKKLRLTVVWLLIVSLIIPLMSSPVHAESILSEQTVTTSERDPDTVLSDVLQEKLVTAGKDEQIPVTIRLNDGIDLDVVEQKAIRQANLSATEKAILSADTARMSEEESRSYQLEALEVRDKIYTERLAILKEYYTKKNGSFIAENGLSDARIGSVGVFTPYIRDVLLTRGQIEELEENPEVSYMDYVAGQEGTDFALADYTPTDFPSVNDTYKIVNGDVCINNGYTGSGIRVGIVEDRHPRARIVGHEDNSIHKAGGATSEEGDHATMVCGIIKKFAPDCSIYSRTVDEIDDVFDACNSLIQQDDPVHVINISYGKKFFGKYDAYAYEMNDFVKTTKVTVIVAAGNESSGTGGSVNCLGLAPNVITVGAVISSGTDQTANNAYLFYPQSSYGESSGVLNKPDVCAPGVVEIFGYEKYGTSFATPHVTGTVVQMMSRNVGLTNKPETLKAILIASASFNGGSSMSYVTGTRASNEEGAGVIDAGFCYQVAHNGRRTHFDTNANTEVYTYNVYCDTITIPFRVACAWEAEMDIERISMNEYVYDLVAPNFDMYIYKNGTLVAYSNASTYSSSNRISNYEIIELSTSTLATYGAGYYQVKIVRIGDYINGGSIRIGLAWEQR